ncbi:MAG: dicarboxylate/amino acid:cation symporter [Arcobacter sp.]|uniref:dicarboxylate/amino acid:cation symporter n=1 Tax=Arcobacter sp. TaxID=1872629 RepID=UPI003D013A97
MLKKLWFQVILGMIAGLVLGLFLSPSAFAIVDEKLSFMLAPWIALIGNIFLALIKMIVIPLVVSSIILGIMSAKNVETLKKLGFYIFPYFILTTFVAVILGIINTTIINPGSYVSKDVIAQMNLANTQVTKTIENISIPDMIVDLIPVSIAKAELAGNILAFVILAIFIGVALLNLKVEESKPLVDLSKSLQAFSMKIVEWAMKLAPYSVFGLICNITIKIGFQAISSMFMYILTVLFGLVLLLGFYLIIVYFSSKMKPFEFLGKIKEVQLMAFSTSSSAAVMPLSIKTAENNLEIPPTISKFVIPLGATINMDGTALYQVSAAIFLTQLFGIELSFFELIVLAITTVGASIGTPSTPGVGIVILATILQSIGVPLEGIALILGVDRILDMCRTTINVTGDLTASLFIKRVLGIK